MYFPDVLSKMIKMLQKGGTSVWVPIHLYYVYLHKLSPKSPVGVGVIGPLGGDYFIFHNKPVLKTFF